MKKFLSSVIFVLVILMLSCSILFSEPVIEKKDKGEIDWTTGMVTAKGIGVPKADAKSKLQAKKLARRAAIVDAQRNLLEIIQGVHIKSETTVKDLMVESDVIKTSVEGLLKGAIVLDEKENPDGSYEVTVGVKLFGKQSLGNIIYPDMLKEGE